MPDRITQEILAEIVGIAADAVICMDEFQRVTFFNKGAEAIFGYTPEEIIGLRIEVLIPERYRANHARQVAEFGRSGVTARRMGERREIAGLRKGGQEFPAEAAISQVHQSGATIYAVVLRDVGARKKFELRQQFLASAGEKLASSFGTGEVLQYVADLAVPAVADAAILENRVEDGFRAGAVRHVDPILHSSLQAIVHTGTRKPPAQHPLSEIARTRAPVLFQQNAASQIIERSSIAAYIDAMKAMQPTAALYLPLVARGQLIGVLSLFRAARGFDGDDLGFAEDLARLGALALDNSRLLDVVRAGLRAREEMIGVVSHDLRNPVAAVKMLSRSLVATAPNSSAKENLTLIAQAAEQMDLLIRDLLDLSRIDAGQLRIAAEESYPADLLNDSLQILLPLCEAKSIALDVQIAVGLPKVLVDPERFQQAMSNLVGNSLKFTPAGGKIVVAAKREGDFVQFTVADNGRGIDPEHLPKVFDRYWQSSRTDRQGAGLGLAITRGIIESHGGRIWIDSTPGEGTTTSFLLPISADGVSARLKPH